MLKKALFLSMAFALIASMAMAGGQGEEVEESEIVWARYGDADTLDPHRATSTLSMQVWDQIYDTLLAFDKEGNPQPHLARDWNVSDDGLVYTFYLHEGIKNHDGTTLNARDVKYTIDRAFDDKNPSVTKGSWGPISRVEVVNDLEFKIYLETKFAAFIPFLADSFSSIIPRSNEDLGREYGSTRAIGSGPWKLVSWVKGDRIVLERHEGYQNFGKPFANK